MLSWKPLLFIPLALLLIGCSKKSGPATATVKGKITLDSATMASGKITFEDPTPGIPAVTIDVKDGMYEGSVPVGKKTVRIESFKLVDPAKNRMKGEMYEKKTEQNFLPAKYNTASTLSKEVVAGSNAFDFEVTSK